jgi:epsilon-lactone hydrolase
VDLTGEHPIPAARQAADVLLTPELLAGWAAAYASGTDLRDPGISPLFADLTGLGPMLIESGGCDLLLDDAVRLAAHAGESNVDAELHINHDMIHDWPLFAGAFPEAGDTLTAAAAWLHTAIKTPPR